MSSTTSRQFVATTALPDFDPIVRAFIDILRREGMPNAISLSIRVPPTS